MYCSHTINKSVQWYLGSQTPWYSNNLEPKHCKPGSKCSGLWTLFGSQTCSVLSMFLLFILHFCFLRLFFVLFLRLCGTQFSYWLIDCVTAVHCLLLSFYGSMVSLESKIHQKRCCGGREWPPWLVAIDSFLLHEFVWCLFKAVQVGGHHCFLWEQIA